MENAAETAALEKKRRVGSLEELDLSTHLVRLKTPRLAVVSPGNSASSVKCEYSACESATSSDNIVVSAVCSSSGSSELETIEEENIGEETGDSLDCRERREKTTSIEDRAESGEMEATARALESNSRRHFKAEKMPSEDELEEFFAAAEKNLQKQFVDKYNYDIAKDGPLAGRYEWVCVQRKSS